MDRRSLLVSTTVVLIASSAGYYLADLLLALNLAVVYGVASWLTFEYVDALPNTDDWQVNKWNTLWVVSTVVGGNALVNNTFDVPLGLGISQMMLLCGTTWAGYFAAVAHLTEAKQVSADSDAVVDSEKT